MPSCAGRLWCSVKVWFVSSLAACFLAGMTCTELAGLRSFASKETAGEVHILHNELCSLHRGSPIGVEYQTRAQAHTSREVSLES